MSKTLVLFDFDGTLTKGDTFPQFIFFSQGYFRTALGVIVFLPVIFLFFLKIISGAKLKQWLIAFYFRGKTESRVKIFGAAFINKMMKSKGLNEDLIEKLKEYKNKDGEVCIVSASLDVWIEPFCKEFGLDYLCTEVLYEEGNCTGKFKTPNCNHEEKANRIRKKYNLSEYSKIIVYGNSNGDEAMMNLAHEKHMV